MLTPLKTIRFDPGDWGIMKEAREYEFFKVFENESGFTVSVTQTISDESELEAAKKCLELINNAMKDIQSHIDDLTSGENKNE